MASITDPNVRDRFASAMEEVHNKHLKAYADIVDITAELSHKHREFLSSALESNPFLNPDTCLKKSKDDEKLFESIQEYKRDLEHKQKALKEKRHALSEIMSEVQEKEMQKEDLIQKIQKLKEEQMKREELIESQNRANKNRLRNLQKARFVFQDHLGLEIRTVIDKTQLVKAENVQFVFRSISLSDLDSPYVITMGIKEDGSYQIVSSDPVLECLPALESRLRETNNLPAFLANVRKEFISKARP